MQYTEIEKLFDPFLLYDIDIIQNNKDIIKSGKLKMVSAKNNNIKLFLEINNSLKNFELYYPFDYTLTDESITFDYRYKSFYKNNIVLSVFLSAYHIEEPLKIADSIITIKIKK